MRRVGQKSSLRNMCTLANDFYDGSYRCCREVRSWEGGNQGCAQVGLSAPSELSLAEI